MDYPDFYWSFYSGERRYRGFSWLGLHFFSFWLSWEQEFLGWIWSEPTNDTHQPLNRPFGLLCIFPAFFSFFDKIAFSSGTLGLRSGRFYWVYVDKKDLNFQQKRKAFGIFLDGLISSLTTTPPASCHHQPLLCEVTNSNRHLSPTPPSGSYLII